MPYKPETGPQRAAGQDSYPRECRRFQDMSEHLSM